MVIRIVVADDHPLIRSGIRTELSFSSEFEIAGEAVNGDDALALTLDLKPDVLILDVNMPGLKAVEVVTTIKKEPKACGVIVLTGFGDPATILGLLNAGADGYLLKDEAPATLAEAIRAVARGGTWVSQAISQKLLGIVRGKQASQGGGSLTRREREILDFLSSGRTNKEIAIALQTSERTVEFHVSNILGKLGVKSRWEAVIWAKERQLI